MWVSVFVGSRVRVKWKEGRKERKEWALSPDLYLQENRGNAPNPTNERAIAISLLARRFPGSAWRIILAVMSAQARGEGACPVLLQVMAKGTVARRMRSLARITVATSPWVHEFCCSCSLSPSRREQGASGARDLWALGRAALRLFCLQSACTLSLHQAINTHRQQ